MRYAASSEAQGRCSVLRAALAAHAEAAARWWLWRFVGRSSHRGGLSVRLLGALPRCCVQRLCGRRRRRVGGLSEAHEAFEEGEAEARR